MDVGTGYRELRTPMRVLGPLEIVQPGDLIQCVETGRTFRSDDNHWGSHVVVATGGCKFRALRSISREQEAAAHYATKETGHTVDEVRAAQSPEGMKKVQHIASRASEELGKPADRIFMGQAPSIDPESDVPTYNSAHTHVTIPVNHPWVPKPFTPNKYTRNMPTLDGRTVPVDVYCVLAAFPTGSAAVDHAIKKLLAPGQRGHKDRIQDLKEARASLTRAIELEEAVQG